MTINQLRAQDYNPDILNTLANLSSDEVFTPPEVANQVLDLLPQELFQSPRTTFLDPAAKSGVFLREIARRLMTGLEEVFPDEQERRDHIFHHQLFGIAITELTSLMSRRSLYCSKFPNSKYSVSQFDSVEGNIRFKQVEHRFGGKRCAYCGARESQFGKKAREGLEYHAYEFIHTLKPEEIFGMKFDVIIGNPPYQLDDGGAQASASPIYNSFVNQAKKLNPRFLTMIIPARWYAGGKGLDEFRSTMLTDQRIRELHDYINASDCFPGVEIKGGICYFLWTRDTKGDCIVNTYYNRDLVSSMKRPLIENNNDTFIRHNDAISILHKIQKKREESFSNLVQSAMTFGFRTFFKDFDRTAPAPGYVKVFANKSQGYIKLSSIKRGTEFLNKWKVYVPEAGGVGDMQKDILKPILGHPNTICTETYVMNGPYEDEEQAKNVISYIRTKFFHFLVGLKKITQHTTQRVYQFVPIQDFSKPWTDAELYAKYHLTEEEIAFIESMIRPLDTEGGEQDG